VSRKSAEISGSTVALTSRALTVASLALSLFPGRAKWKRVAAGLLGLGGALALRYAVVEAGKASARDPRATFEQQRAGLGAAEKVRIPLAEQIPADYAVPFEGEQPMA